MDRDLPRQLSTSIDTSSVSTNIDIPLPMPLCTPTDLGLLVRERRRARGLSQQHLADEAGVSRAWIVALEGGKPGVELGLVLRTLRALGIALEVAGAPPPADPPLPEALVDLDAVIAEARR